MILDKLFEVLDKVRKLTILSDDEELDNLLKTAEDKLKFQKAIDDVCYRGKVVEVEIGGRNLKIEKL